MPKITCSPITYGYSVYVVCTMAVEQVDCEEVAELERCEPGPISDTNSNIATESEADLTG